MGMAHSGQHPRPLILFFKETTSLESTGDDEPPPAVIFSPEIDGYRILISLAVAREGAYDDDGGDMMVLFSQLK
ncbi:hypothetical protein E3N88_18170 [Mikania micrantha]|uniref:Uncharacterized protein n=1 Tax=Mikania micrantha TaxID=192012 RepID=A0A5N6NUH8_9ASTR|nr:hypothetical protein E3N88_18170 [Mikania micrantha]